MLLEDTARRKPSVGLTPLIDVVFILLIFFMLVVHFKTFQQVPLSVVATAELTPNYIEDAWMVSRDGSNVCSVRKVSVPCDGVGQILPKTLEKPVIINFGDAVSLGEIVAMQTRLMQLGYGVVLGLGLEARG